MNQTHIHLLITHLPIFGSLLGAVVLIYGLYAKSASTYIAAYLVFILSALGAILAYVTGEAAEESVEDIAGITKSLIDSHEDAALFALTGMIILSVFSAISIYLTIKRTDLSRKVAIAALVIAVICFGISSWTGYLGGQIRHTEIHGK